MYSAVLKQLALQQVLAMLVVASPVQLAGYSPSSAMIYRGKTACEDCPEAVGELLKGIYPNIIIIYAGPSEDTQINATTLSDVDVFAQGGGDGMSPDSPALFID